MSGNKNGTIFDYNNNRRGLINLSISNPVGQVIKIENIIFENVKNTDELKNIFHILTRIHNHYLIIFENCTFRNNDIQVFSLTNYCTKLYHENPSMILNNCTF